MPGFVLDGNVYLDGAGKSKHDKTGIIDDTPTHGEFSDDTFPLTLSFTPSKAVFSAACQPVTSKRLGSFPVPKMAMETQDGRPLDVTTDYYGGSVTATAVLPGPFQNIVQGKNTFALWPRKGAD
jgi:hypothetical protein